MSNSDLEEYFQQTLHLAVTEPQFFVEQCHCGVDIRSELHTCSSGRIGCLQFVPTLHRRAVTDADSTVDVKLSMNDGARDFGLVPNSRLGLRQLTTATIGAAARQRHIVSLVDLLRNNPAVVLAVILSALSPRLLRIGLASFAKRSRLTFPLALNFLKSLRQIFDLFDQGINDRLLLQQRLASRAVGRDLGNIHDPKIVVKSSEFHQQQFSAP